MVIVLSIYETLLSIYQEALEIVASTSGHQIFQYKSMSLDEVWYAKS